MALLASIAQPTTAVAFFTVLLMISPSYSSTTTYTDAAVWVSKPPASPGFTDNMYTPGSVGVHFAVKYTH